MNWQQFLTNLHVIGTQLILLIGLFTVLIFDAIQKKRNYITSFIITIITFTIAIYYTINYQWGKENILYVNVFSSDKFALIISVLILICGILISIFSLSYLKINNLEKAEYFTLILSAVYGMIAMIQSVDLLMAFICLEIMSLSIYVLVGFDKNRVKSQEAALKYFLLGSFASAFFLMGLALIYGTLGTVNYATIAAHIAAGSLFKLEILLAFVLIFTSLAFKIAYVPFHMWSPDVYQGSPTPVTSIMATAVKASSFTLLIKILITSFTPITLETNINLLYLSKAPLFSIEITWKYIVYLLAILSMIFGNLIALSQTNIKRLLAYSSIAHIGYISLGLLAGTSQGITAIQFYLINYSIITIGLFILIHLIDIKEENAQELNDYKGLGFKCPFYAFLLTFFLLGLIGLPPTSGFTSKFLVLASAISEGYYFISAIAVLTSVYASFYYLRIIYYMYMKDQERPIEPLELKPYIAVLLITCLTIVFYYGILPNKLLTILTTSLKDLAFLY